MFSQVWVLNSHHSLSLDMLSSLCPGMSISLLQPSGVSSHEPSYVNCASMLVVFACTFQTQNVQHGRYTPASSNYSVRGVLMDQTPMRGDQSRMVGHTSPFVASNAYCLRLPLSHSTVNGNFATAPSMVQFATAPSMVQIATAPSMVTSPQHRQWYKSPHFVSISIRLDTFARRTTRHGIGARK